MNKLIYRKLSMDILYFFTIASLSITLIVWVIQSVNYLDFVSEDGHSMKVYFMYSLLSLPKIFNRLILFIFFISVFFTISKYEENNEILIFWSYGIKKAEFINKIIKFSFLFFIINIIFSALIVPKTQDLAKSYIRNSNIDYFPSLIKSQRFNDAANKLTIFVEKKDYQGFIKSIFIKENLDGSKSKIITAKEGVLVKKNNSYYLILYNGRLINVDSNNTNIIKFEKSEFNLSRYDTKSTIFPKIQETNSVKLIECFNSFLNNQQGFSETLFKCNKDSINPVVQEIYKRLVVPFYIILSAFVASCLIMKSKTQFNFFKFKTAIFLIGFLLIVFSEGSSSILSFYNFNKSIITLLPFLISILSYFIFIKFKKI